MTRLIQAVTRDSNKDAISRIRDRDCTTFLTMELSPKRGALVKTLPL